MRIASHLTQSSPSTPAPRGTFVRSIYLTARALSTSRRIFSLRRKEALAQANITHVVSVLRLPLDDALFAKYKHLVVEVDDVEDENLLEHFAATNAFIREGLDGGGGVLVHWLVGGLMASLLRDLDVCFVLAPTVRRCVHHVSLSFKPASNQSHSNTPPHPLSPLNLSPQTPLLNPPPTNPPPQRNGQIPLNNHHPRPPHGPRPHPNPHHRPRPPARSPPPLRAQLRLHAATRPLPPNTLRRRPRRPPRLPALAARARRRGQRRVRHRAR